MEISAKLVKDLRDRTGAGMMECKKALVESNGDIEIAIENMRKFVPRGNGSNKRDFLYVNDVCDLYACLSYNLYKNHNLSGEIFNAGWENKSVTDIANIVKRELGFDINVIFSKTDDNRSYHISSKKIKNVLNFHTKFTIENAVNDLKKAFEKNLLIDPLNNPNYFNIKKMQKLNLK